MGFDRDSLYGCNYLVFNHLQTQNNLAKHERNINTFNTPTIIAVHIFYKFGLIWPKCQKWPCKQYHTEIMRSCNVGFLFVILQRITGMTSTKI